MKKLLSVYLLIVIIFTTGCGTSSGTGSLSTASIEIARAAGRIGLSVLLQNRGVSAEDTQAILADLRIVVDAVIAGQDVRAIIGDLARWEPIRADLVKKFARVIVEGSKVDGVALVDQVSAEALTGSLLDTFAAAIRGR